MDADLRPGRWQDVLADVTCDAFISDPPYSERTHGGQTHARHDGVVGALSVSDEGLGYDHIAPDDVAALVAHWSPRTRGWFCAFTSHDLVPVYEAALSDAGRYVFAPLACVQSGRNVRLQGDGPANWTDWLVVARPKRGPCVKWGALPGAYVTKPDGRTGEGNIVAGQKPLALMQAVVRDFSRRGDLVADGYAGSGTTVLAALTEGRRAVGAEVDPGTYDKARARLATWQPSLFMPELQAVPQDLFGERP